MYDQEDDRTDDDYSQSDDNTDQDEVQNIYAFSAIMCKYLFLMSLLNINRVYRQFHI